MNLDIIILIAILIIFIGLLLLAVIYLPRIIIKQKAKAYGIKIDLNQAAFLQKSQCVNREFFKNVRAIWDIETIAIEQLASHVLAGGNLANIKNGITELKKQNLGIDFSIISAIDLTNRDIKIEVEKSKEIKTIRVNDIRNNYLTIEYKIIYRNGFPNSIWSDKTNKTRKKLLENKLKTFVTGWNEPDPIKTEHFIRENILTTNFLEKEIGSIIENQEYKISKRR